MTYFLLESAKHKHHHHHHHDEDIDLPNPHSHLGPEERYTRLLMMLEAQFGSDISPIERPRLPTTTAPTKQESATSTPAIKKDPDAPTPTPDNQGNSAKEEDEDEGYQDEDKIAELEAAELSRLQALGIPVPGIEIKVDKHVARVWLEDLEVECANAVMRDRVRVVVERAVETVAGMWTEGPPSASVGNGNGNENGVMAKGKMDEVEAKA